MMDWLVLHSGAGEPAYNMALDEALLESIGDIGQPVLRFYEWIEPCATFGYSQKIADIESNTILRPLIRRCTGGGLVPHDGDWTYSLTFPPSHEWTSSSATQSYQHTHALLLKAFAAMGVKTELADCCQRPKSGECFEGFELHDLLYHGKKIAGAAQRRNRFGLLIQGSVQPLGDWPLQDWLNALTGDCPKLEEPPGTRAEELAATKYKLDSHNRKR